MEMSVVNIDRSHVVQIGIISTITWEVHIYIDGYNVYEYLIDPQLYRWVLGLWVLDRFIEMRILCITTW